MLDVRSPEEYGEGHIPGAINVWIESPQFANRAGLFAPAEAPVVLVVASPTDLDARGAGARPHRARRRSPAICSGG